MGVQSPSTLASDANGPRKGVPNEDCVRMGIRINPWKLSNSII